MNIIIKGTGFSLTPAIKDYVDQKIGGLEKFLTHVNLSGVEARVEVGRITEHHHKGNVYRAEVNLILPGQMLRVEAESDDVYAAIDAVHDELKRQIVSKKEKKLGISRRVARRLDKGE